jgi:hypothetical protein
MANFIIEHDKELRAKIDTRLQLVLLNTIKVAERKHGINEVKRCANLIAEANHEALKEIDFIYIEDTHQVVSTIIMSLGDNLKKMLALDFKGMFAAGSIIDVSPINIGLFLDVYSRLSNSLNLPVDISSKVIYKQAKKKPKIKQKRAKNDSQNRATKTKTTIKKKKLPRKLKIKKQIDELEERLANCPEWARNAYKHKIELLKEKL